jgi:hypothetical protein
LSWGGEAWYEQLALATRLGAPGSNAAAFSEIILYKRMVIPILRLLPLGTPGGVAEWSKAAVLKTAERKLRGFESLLLRRC